MKNYQRPVSYTHLKWLDFEKCYQDVKENKINHCIYIEELDIVKKYLRVQ